MKTDLIDLTKARKSLDDAKALLEDLDGFELPNLDDIDDWAPGDRPGREELQRMRSERAQTSRDLMFLADRLAAAETFVRDTYWVFRGEPSVFDTLEPVS
jgi:hypothetical protein